MTITRFDPFREMAALQERVVEHELGVGKPGEGDQGGVVLAVQIDGDVIALRMVVASLDGARVERAVVRGTDPQAIGAAGVALLPVADLL